jgi:putative ABC transport system permease protein
MLKSALAMKKKLLKIKRKTPIAWLNLLHSKVKLLVSLGGITFAVFLIFMQLGFLGAVLNSAKLVYDHLNFDILLISKKSLDATVTQPISRDRLYQAYGFRGIKSVSPFYIGFKQWRNPETKLSRAILVMGIDIKDDVFRIPEIESNLELLKHQDNLLFDKISRSEYGKPRVGEYVELGGRSHRISGGYKMGTALRFDGSVIVSDTQFVRIFTGSSLEDVSLGLIAVEPGTDIAALIRQLRTNLPGNIEVLSRQQAEFRDQKYWLTSTNIGYIFGTGALMGFFVGAVISYQALYQNVAEYLHEYALLKAMGYSNLHVSLIVIRQALILAVAGFSAGFTLALFAYYLTFTATNLPIYMTLQRIVGVFLTSIFMCTISGVISVRKVLVSNPASLFG